MTVAQTPLRDGGAPHRHQLALVVAVVIVTIAGVLVLEHTVFQSSSSTTSSNGVQGSGVPTTQARKVAEFDSIELAGSNNVTVQVGAKQSVVVHADDNLLARVTTEVQGGHLVIGNTNGSFTTRSPMSVEITVPTLTAVTLSGSGNIAATGIDTSSLTVSLPGSGVIQASGTAARLVVSVDGSGEAQLAQLVAHDVQADVNGSGEILVTATESLDASVPGSGTILYSGDPAHVTTSVTGSGAVTHG